MIPKTSPGSGEIAVRRVLLIDDNPSIHSDYLKVLCPKASSGAALSEEEALLFDVAPEPVSTAEYECVSAYQGQEGLKLVEKSLATGKPFQLALVDMRMPPGWDGVETCKRIWEIHPDLTVMFCTAFSDYDLVAFRRELGQAGKFVLLRKPVENTELLLLVEMMFEHGQLGRNLTHLEKQNVELHAQLREIAGENTELREKLVCEI